MVVVGDADQESPFVATPIYDLQQTGDVYTGMFFILLLLYFL